MRELLYGVYQNSPYRILVLVSLAEALLHGQGKFINKAFKVNHDYDIGEIERLILEKIVIGQKSKISIEECREWGDTLIDDCIKQGFIKKFFFIYKKTSFFEQKLKNNLLSGFNKDIIHFINNCDVKVLSGIIPEIEKIKIPSFKIPSKGIGPYKDRLEVLENAEIP